MDSERSEDSLSPEDIAELESNLYMEAANETKPYINKIDIDEPIIIQNMSNDETVMDDSNARNNTDDGNMATASLTQQNETVLSNDEGALSEAPKIDETIDKSSAQLNADIIEVVVPDKSKDTVVSATATATFVKDGNENKIIDKDKKDSEINAFNSLAASKSHEFKQVFKTSPKTNKAVNNNKKNVNNNNNKIEKDKKKNNKNLKKKNKTTTNQKAIVHIVLSDSNEDNDDDVIVLPTQPVPVYTIDDSADEQSDKSNNEDIANEDNSICENQCLETNSNLSTDDFLENEDRRRLQNDAANDKDILSLISYLDDIANICVASENNIKTNLLSVKPPQQMPINSNNINDVAGNPTVLTSSPSSSTTTTTTTITTKTETTTKITETAAIINEQQEENDNNTKKKNNSSSNDNINTAKVTFGVEETGDFRAMDVYDESSSDSDNVLKVQQQQQQQRQHKTKKQLQHFNAVNSSESDDDDSWNEKYRVKRIRKNRPAVNNTKIQQKIDLTGNTMANNDEDNNINKNLDGSITTQVPYIAVGPAVNNNSSSSSIHAGEHPRRQRRMSDKKFINTLNNLAQNQVNCVVSSDGTSDCTDDDDDTNNSNMAKAPTAREIAEKVLAREEHKRKMKKSSTQISTPITPTPAQNATIAVDSDDDIVETKIATVSVVNENNDKATTSTPISAPNKKPSALGNEDMFGKLRNLFDLIDEGKGIETHAENEMVLSSEDAQSDVENNNSNNDTNNDKEQRKQYYTYNTKDGYEKINNDGPGWTHEMSTFYNEKWENKLMSVDNVLNKMSRKKSDWKINPIDHFPITRRQKELKCFNCAEFGHTRAKCKKPKKEVVCFMCGISGHSEPRCPNTVCLNCGKKSNYFTRSCRNCRDMLDTCCPDCNEIGHTLDMCADKWRRYYDSTESNAEPIYHRTTNNNNNSRKYCSVCAGKNHLAENCRHAKRLLDYPVVTSRIISHAPIYPPVEPQIGIDLKLLYDPMEKPTFQMAKKTQNDKYYGRFLQSANLLKLLPPTENDNTTNNNNSAIIDDDSNARDVHAVNDIHNDNVRDIDSDSNYSFSENFPPKEVHSDGDKRDNDGKVSAIKEKHTFNFNDDFVPLSNNNDKDNYDDDEGGDDYIDINSRKPLGISKNYQIQFDELKELQAEAKEAEEIPCEAKIFLSPENSKFLLSREGQIFLEENSIKYNIKSKILFGSMGHVLYINGISKQQEDFHAALQKRMAKHVLEKHQNTCVIQNIPKNVNAMISHLRTAINQLFTKFGNVEYLYECAKIPVYKRNKSSMRAADKARRYLNMILIGQAGLNNGKEYFDKLLTYLKELLLLSSNNTDQNTTNMLTTDMRKNINDVYKMIFTAYCHNDYDELLKEYLSLKDKNYLLHLNLDPMLLGQSVINVNKSIQEKADNSDVQKEVDGNNEEKVHENQKKPSNKRKSNSLVEPNEELTQNKAKKSKCTEQRISQQPQQVQTASTPNKQKKSEKMLLSKQLEEMMKITKQPQQQSSQKQQQQQEDKQQKNKERAQQQQQQQQQQRIIRPMLEKSNYKVRQVSSAHMDIFQHSSKPSRKITITTNNSNNKNRDNYNQQQQQQQRHRDNYNQQQQKAHQKRQESRRVVATPSPQGTNLNEPSYMWSQQSINYIKPCLPVTINNKQLHKQILRVLEKAREGYLSYNDYRAVIKLHNTVMKHEE